MFYTNPLNISLKVSSIISLKVKTGCSPHYCHHLLQLKQFRFSHLLGSIDIYLDLY